MPLSIDDITHGWTRRPPAAVEMDETTRTRLTQLPCDDSAVELVAQALGQAVDALAAVQLESGLHTLEAVLPVARRLVDALEGELGRITHALTLCSDRPQTGPRSTAADVARRAGCAQRRIALSAHIGREIALDDRIAAGLRAAELSLDNARILSEVADLPAFDDAAPELLHAAGELTPGRLRSVIDGWLASIPAQEIDGDPAHDFDPMNDSELARRRRDARSKRFVSFTSERNGMTRISALLPREDASHVSRTLQDIAALSADDTTGRSWPQRLADALIEWVVLSEDALRTPRRRPVVVVTHGKALEGLEHGPAHRNDGEIVTDDHVERLLCTGDRRDLTTDETGEALHLGRRRRTFSSSQYLALTRRDGRCRYPGCETAADRCEAHHVSEYLADGGATDLDNGILLCPTHHRHLHRNRERFVGHPDTDLTLIEPSGARRPANEPVTRHAPTRRATKRARLEARVRQRVAGLPRLSPDP